MGISLLPRFILDHYDVREWRHACAVLKHDFPEEWQDVIDLLMHFRLCKSWLLVGGGRKSGVAQSIDAFLFNRGWIEKKFATSVKVDNLILDSPTHKVDCYKNKVALEIEWNNKVLFSTGTSIIVAYSLT